MCADTLGTGEPRFGTGLVRRLVAEQFPAWSGLAVVPVGPGAGTSNVMYRLGEDMVVRLPRTSGAAGDVEKEHRWLPRLAPALPVAVPVPLGLGAPGPGCPWPWSVYRWLDGAIAVPGNVTDPEALARDLAAFVTALHRADPRGGPPSYRCEPLAARDATTREDIAALRGEVDAGAATAVWTEALSAPAPSGPPVWIHADLQPGNLLVADGRLGAVIDFGCLGLGDAAVDLLPAWYVLPSGAREVFRVALGADAAAWARGRGWALSVALAELRHYRTANPFMAGTARRVLARLLAGRD